MNANVPPPIRKRQPNLAIRNNVIILFLKGRTFLINPPFQYKFMLYIVMMSVLSMAVIYGANMMFFSKFIAKGEMLNLPKDHPFFLLIREQKDFMIKIFWGVSCVISVVTGFWGLFFSHRIAGPLYRITKYFDDAALSERQDMPFLKIRTNDFFQELPKSINKYFKVDS